MTLPPAANTFHQPGLTPVETLAEVKKALHIDKHYIVLDEDGWFIRHPLKCRESPSECEETQRSKTMPGGKFRRLLERLGPGTYRLDPIMTASLEPDTLLVPVDPDYDPMMTRLKELGVW